jgi:hypothetical protein
MFMLLTLNLDLLLVEEMNSDGFLWSIQEQEDSIRRRILWWFKKIKGLLPYTVRCCSRGTEEDRLSERWLSVQGRNGLLLYLAKKG